MVDNELIITHKDIKRCINGLKNKSLYYSDIPEELRLHPLIVEAGRKYGVRKSAQRGFDIINNCFYVEEIVLEKGYHKIEEETVVNTFENFVSYYEFLNGDIYDKACYYQYSFTNEDIVKYSINLDKINYRSLIEHTLTDFTLEPSQDELKKYNAIEKQKNSIIKQWLSKFYECNNYVEFRKVVSNLKKSIFRYSLEFFVFNFINYNKEKAFPIIMDYINHDTEYDLCGLEEKMCLIYDPESVYNAFNEEFFAPTTIKRHKQNLKQYIEYLNIKNDEFLSSSCFDDDTHFYACSHYLKTNKNRFRYTMYFETFDELAKYLGNDLSNCDLSKAILPNVDFTKFRQNEETKLPVQSQSNVTYVLNKTYDRHKKCFVVNQLWLNSYGVEIKSYKHTFKYFIDFVSFLNNDLSNADLLFCDGLNNVKDFSGLILDNIRVKSNLLNKLGIEYKKLSFALSDNFTVSKKNEIETIDNYNLERILLDNDESKNFKPIHYISDLHFIHKLINANCITEEDVIYEIQKYIDQLLKNIKFNCLIEPYEDVILIGGDVSSNYNIFTLFVKMLKATIDEKHLNVYVIFVLGNHELWDFQGKTLDEIVNQYKCLIEMNGMYLLQNNIIYIEDKEINKIETDELINISSLELRNRLLKSRIVLFGGIGFSGYNNEFNANLSIYKSTLNREQEIEESKKIENLYNKICTDLSNQKVIVFTHMPLKDWSSNIEPVKNFIYVSGHNHRNYFYDDGDYRIYSDNQVGYTSKTCYLKYFYLETQYDIFTNYLDGIYEITREQYIDFYRGKNLEITFNRIFYKLYMLKKNDTYMFIVQNTSSGNLNVLNGGSLITLEHKDVEYYYQNMDRIINHIKTPLDKFSSYQKSIADKIKEIGGYGTIHGAIIDIDMFNHIYVNPINGKVTAYWAFNIIDKVVFNDIPTLLQNNCPEIYMNYLKMIENTSDNALAVKGYEVAKTSNIYLSTDIYKASRVIKKMQKLNKNILSVWIEPKVKKITK